MSQQNIIKTGHNLFEKIDDRTIKKLCVSCGGKGYYLLCNIFDHKGELVSCEMCEQGFKYERICMNHGKKG